MVMSKSSSDLCLCTYCYWYAVQSIICSIQRHRISCHTAFSLQSNCREQNEEEGENGEQEGEEGEDGEGRRLEENDEQQVEDSVTNIVRNCGSVFQAFGVDLGDMDMDEDNGDLQQALHDLSIHIRIEKAIASGAFNFESGINYDFAANGNEDNGGEGNYDEEFYNLLQSLDIDANELDEDDVMNIKLKLAVKSGALKDYLEANAAFGSVVNDWEGLIQGFFYSLGIQEEINLEDIDSYLAADIYNTEYELEEYGCQQAMLNQFGKSDAKDYGYIENTNPIADFFNATVEKFTSGEIAGIVIGVLIAVGIIACCAFCCGKKSGAKSRRSNSKSRPLIDGTAV